MAPAVQTILNVLNETAMHKAYCEQWGITQAELENTPESPATTACGAFLLDSGLQGPIFDYPLLTFIVD